MSDADRVTVRYAEESTFGTAPGGTYIEARVTGCNLTGTTESVRSDELRSDRQVTDVQRSAVSAGGTIPFIASYASHEDWFEAAIQSSGWDTPVSDVTATITAAASDNSFNQVGGFTGMAVGDWVYSSGFATGNNGVSKITSWTADKIIVAGLTLVDDSGASGETIKHFKHITNGTTQPSFTVERENADLSNIFTLFRGQTLSGFTIGGAAGALVRGDFSFSGQDEVPATATDASSTTAANTNALMNVIESSAGAIVAGSAKSIMQFSLTVDNELRMRREIGSTGPVSIGAGKCRVSGSIQSYLSDHTLKTINTNFTDTDVAIIVTDGESKFLVFDIPGCKLTTSEDPVTGESTDVIETNNFEAFRDSTEGVTIRIATIDAS